MMGSVFAVPIFAQTFLGLTATQAGFIFVPMGLCIPLSAAVFGRFLAKYPTRWVMAGSSIGAAVCFYLLSFIDPRSTAIDLAIPLGLMALCMGASLPKSTGLVANSVPREVIGVASSILALGRNIGGAFGIAIFATLINVFTENNVLAISKNSILNSVTPAAHATYIALIELKAEVMAYSEIYVIAAITVFLGVFTVFLIKEPKNTPGATKEQLAMAEAG